MNKTYTTANGARFRVDGQNLQVVKLPVNGAIADAICPECFGQKVKLICDFVQTGFDTDVHDEVVECRVCHAWFVIEQELPQ